MGSKTAMAGSCVDNHTHSDGYKIKGHLELPGLILSSLDCADTNKSAVSPPAPKHALIVRVKTEFGVAKVCLPL